MLVEELLRCDPLIFRKFPVKPVYCCFCLGNTRQSASRVKTHGKIYQITIITIKRCIRSSFLHCKQRWLKSGNWNELSFRGYTEQLTAQPILASKLRWKKCRALILQARIAWLTWKESQMAHLSWLGRLMRTTAVAFGTSLFPVGADLVPMVVMAVSSYLSMRNVRWVRWSDTKITILGLFRGSFF